MLTMQSTQSALRDTPLPRADRRFATDPRPLEWPLGHSPDACCPATFTLFAIHCGMTPLSCISHPNCFYAVLQGKATVRLCLKIRQAHLLSGWFDPLSITGKSLLLQTNIQDLKKEYFLMSTTEVFVCEGLRLLQGVISYLSRTIWLKRHGTRYHLVFHNGTTVHISLQITCHVTVIMSTVLKFLQAVHKWRTK